MEYKVRGISLLLFQKLFNTIERRGGARVVLLFGRIFSGCTPGFDLLGDFRTV